MSTKSNYSLSNVSASEWASAGAKGLGAMMSSQGTLVAGRFDEKQMRYNATLMDYAAEDAIKRGDKAVDNIRRKTKQLVSEQRAAFAAQGVDVTEGSAMETQEDTHFWGAYDEVQAKNNAFMESYGLKMQALNLRSQAEATRLGTDYKSRMQLISGALEGGADIAKASGGGV